MADYSFDKNPKSLLQFGWTVDPDATGVLRQNTSFEASGPDAPAITGFVLSSLSVRGCAYSIGNVGAGYELRDARAAAGADGRTGADGREVNLLSAGETKNGRPVDVQLRRAGRSATLAVCDGSTCRPLATIARPVTAIGFRKSPDTLMGTLGVVEEAEGGGRLLINVDIDPSRYR